MILIPNDISNVSIESGSYEPYTNITLVESDSDDIRYYVKNIVASNTSNDNITLSLYLNNNIILSKEILPNEFFIYTFETVVTNDSPLSAVIGPSNSLDLSVLFIQKFKQETNENQKLVTLFRAILGS